jgi:hypothetical protein
MESATGFIKLCLQLERVNEHVALEHAISFSGTVTRPPPPTPVASTIHTLYYLATADCGGGA